MLSIAGPDCVYTGVGTQAWERLISTFSPPAGEVASGSVSSPEERQLLPVKWGICVYERCKGTDGWGPQSTEDRDEGGGRFSKHERKKLKVRSLSRIRLFATPWTVTYQAPLSCLENTEVGCHFLLQGIFPTQRLNPGLPHCGQTLYRLSHQGSHERASVCLADSSLQLPTSLSPSFFPNSLEKPVRYKLEEFFPTCSPSPLSQNDFIVAPNGLFKNCPF